MNILIYGHKGWIASILIHFWKIMYPDDVLVFTDTRICHENVEQLESEIASADRVFCVLGRTSGVINGQKINNIDYLETKLDENVRDNMFAPVLLASLCKKYDKHLSYIGTGCIFSRDTNHNDYVYTEADTPDFKGSAYSIVKGYTDTVMKTFSNVLNLRIRMPVMDDLSDKNFITKIVSFKKIYSMPNSMTYLPDLVPIMINMSRAATTGTFNMVNGSISHKEILDLYREIVDPSHEYELINEAELSNLLVAKRSNNILSNTKLKANYTIMDMKTCIVSALHNIKGLKTQT